MKNKPSDSSTARIIVTFHSVFAALDFETKAKGIFPVKLIPAPRELTSSCATAAMIPDGNQEAVQSFIAARALEVDGVYLL